jgi:hypothetical protein
MRSFKRRQIESKRKVFIRQRRKGQGSPGKQLRNHPARLRKAGDVRLWNCIDRYEQTSPIEEQLLT